MKNLQEYIQRNRSRTGASEREEKTARTRRWTSGEKEGRRRRRSGDRPRESSAHHKYIDMHPYLIRRASFSVQGSGCPK